MPACFTARYSLSHFPNALGLCIRPVSVWTFPLHLPLQAEFYQSFRFNVCFCRAIAHPHWTTTHKPWSPNKLNEMTLKRSYFLFHCHVFAQAGSACWTLPTLFTYIVPICLCPGWSSCLNTYYPVCLHSTYLLLKGPGIMTSWKLCLNFSPPLPPFFWVWMNELSLFMFP